MSSQAIKALCASHGKPHNTSLPASVGLVLLFFLAFDVLAAGADTGPPEKYSKAAAFAFSQAAINRQTGDYKFVDQDGSVVDFSQYRGKPLLVSLIYTSCHHICPVLTKYLAGVVRLARDALGEKSFSVVSIGFDTAADTPERMRWFARQRNIDMQGWDFLSADAATIQALSQDIGFIFFKSPRGFDHLTQVTLLDRDGKVYRQIYGLKYDPQRIVEPLKELLFGQQTKAPLLTGWINNVRLFCTVYDPRSGRYEFDYSIFIGIIMGVIILGAIAAFIVIEWRKNRISGTS